MFFYALKNNSKKFLLMSALVLIILITLIIRTSLAKYKITESIQIVKGTINYSPSDFSLMGIYIESDNGYVSTDTIPESGYNFNSEESYCKIGDTVQDVTISYDFDTNTLSVAPLSTKGMKCYLYFEKVKTSDIILSNKTISERIDFNTILTSDTTGTIYSAEDNDGTSYYFAGSPTDNWVKFGGFYWRIIRINGDGTIRMIYSGNTNTIDGLENNEEILTNGYNDQDTQYFIVDKSTFNSTADNNMYVGYMYTSGQVHGLETNSTIKGILDNWYDDNLTDFESYIDTNAGFCGDRQPSTSSSSLNGSGGTGTDATYYAGYLRLITNKSPSLKCTDNRDLYTLSSSTKGNKTLTNPIGLITADEAAYAGWVFRTVNSNYYLYTGHNYWTITPYSFSSSIAHMFYIESSTIMYFDFTLSTPLGVRPVINLKDDTKFKAGTLGTADSPYEVI